MSNIALKVERSAADAVTAGAPVVFENIVYTDGKISCDTGTGVVTFNEPGRYIVDWRVSAQAAVSPAGLAFAISTSQGDFLEGDTSNKMDEVAGIGIVDVAAAPVTMSLINASTGNAAPAASLPVKAALRIIEAATNDAAIKDVGPILNPIGISNEPCTDYRQ